MLSETVNLLTKQAFVSLNALLDTLSRHLIGYACTMILNLFRGLY